MSSLNTTLRYNPSRNRNAVRDMSQDFANLGNNPFFAAVGRELKQLSNDPATAPYFAAGTPCIGLVGQFGLAGYMLRHAQAVLRYDLTPSYWSHAFLTTTEIPDSEEAIRQRGSVPWVWESTLCPPAPFADFSLRNGVSPRRLSDYDTASFRPTRELVSPNVAIIALGLTESERDAIRERAADPKAVRIAYDLPQLLAAWFTYIATRTERRNPIQDGCAIPSAAYVQLAFEAAGIDLSPGAHQRNPTPEHLWQTVRYLHDKVSRVGQPAPREVQETNERPVYAWTCIRDRGGLMAPPESWDEEDWTGWTLNGLPT